MDISKASTRKYFQDICISHTSDTISLRSPAKINLYLAILGKRPDGYHEVENIMHTISLHDLITIRRGSEDIDFSTDSDEIPVDRNNFVIQAAEGFFEESGIPPAVKIHLEKRIPVAAGLGGGSSNAAVTLLGLNSLFGSPLSLAKLHRIASSIGSDAPFFLYGGAGICRGRGEQVKPLESTLSFSGIVVTPPIKVSTASIYKKLKNTLTNKNRSSTILTYLKKNNYAGIAELCYNGLEQTVLNSVEGLEKLKESLVKCGSSKVIVSGSGPSLFGFLPAEYLKEAMLSVVKLVGDAVFVATAKSETTNAGEGNNGNH